MSREWRKITNARADRGPVLMDCIAMETPYADPSMWPISVVTGQLASGAYNRMIIGRHHGERGINMMFPDGSVQYKSLAAVYATYFCNGQEAFLTNQTYGQTYPAYR